MKFETNEEVLRANIMYMIEVMQYTLSYYLWSLIEVFVTIMKSRDSLERVMRIRLCNCLNTCRRGA